MYYSIYKILSTEQHRTICLLPNIYTRPGSLGQKQIYQFVFQKLITSNVGYVYLYHTIVAVEFIYTDYYKIMQNILWRNTTGQFHYPKGTRNYVILVWCVPVHKSIIWFSGPKWLFCEKSNHKP